MASRGTKKGPESVMVLIGKTGTGKSATCNNVLGVKDFQEGKGGLSTTSDCKLVKKTMGERVLSMIDTPGTMDVTDPQAALDTLLGAVDLCPDGIDAFLVTFRCDVRATDEELRAAEEAVELFGPECFKRAIIVFTRGEEFDNDEREFKESLMETREAIPRLDDLLSKSCNRWVLIDNGKSCNANVRKRQVSALLSMVDQVAQFNPRRYSKYDQQQQQNMIKMQQKLREQFWEAERNGMEENMMKLMAAIELQSREFGQQTRQMREENQRLRDRVNTLEGNNKKSSCTLL